MRWLFALLLSLLGLLLLLNLLLGSLHFSIYEILAVLFQSPYSSESTHTILLHYRLPQALVALTAGASLGASGTVVQTLFGNPLADTGLLGVGTGATLGAAIATLLLGTLSLGTYSISGFALTLLLALVGALCVLALLLLLSPFLRSATSLIIVGVMMGAVSSSLIGLITYSATAPLVRQLALWSFGSFDQVGSTRLLPYLCALLPALLLLPLWSRPLDALLLGDDYARSLGLRVRRLRWQLLLLVGWLTAVVSAVCGPIAFIGLAAPHLARLLARRSSHALIIPLSALVGATLALTCLLLARLTIFDSPLPINVLTPLIGAPIVVYLLLKR